MTISNKKMKASTDSLKCLCFYYLVTHWHNITWFYNFDIECVSFYSFDEQFTAPNKS